MIATGTGKALKLGSQGDVDLVMTHAPGAEAKFVADGFGVEPRGIMENDFVILGPKNDPAKPVTAKMPKKPSPKSPSQASLSYPVVMTQVLTRKS